MNISDPLGSQHPSPGDAESRPVVPDYTLIRRIGGGSYGEVWLATSAVDTMRAVKVIYRRAFDHDRPYQREFAGVRKFEPISRSHEGFVDILHVGKNDEAGYFYCVMELADDANQDGDGEAAYRPMTLRMALSERGRLPVAECAAIGLRIAEALCDLHSHELVHRDLKPSNIIFVNGIPKLADIGLVAGVDEAKSYVGTEGFIPPEGPGTPQADLYSLGKLLYEISTGKDRQDYPELPADLRDRADLEEFSELNEIILRACMDDPHARYGSAEPMRDDLAALARGESIRKRRMGERRRAWLKTAGLLAAALVVAAGLFAAAWGTWRFVRPPVHFASRDWVLVTDFENRTGDGVFERSLSTAFSVGLQQSQYANILPRSRIDRALKRMGKSTDTRIDEPLGREICLRENARAVVVCDIANAGRAFALSARLVEPDTGQTIRSYLERAPDRDGVIEALDRIAGRLRRDLGESVGAIRQSARPLPLVTTPSLDALRSFAEGRHQWQKGAYQEAMQFYESALERDPDFAMAHAAMGSALCSFIFNSPAKGKSHYEKALRNVTRITDRERLYIQGSYEKDMGHVNEAVQLHRRYLTAYPDDVEVRYNLGTLLMLNQRSQEAIEQLLEVVRATPSHSGALANIATSYRVLNQADEALAYYAKTFELEPGWITNVSLNHEYGFTLAHAGRTERAREVFQLAVAKTDLKPSGLRSLALLDMYEGRYRDAEVKLRESLLLSRARKDTLRLARGHLYMAMIREGQGDRIGRLRELEAAGRHMAALPDAPVWLCTRIGTGYARAGEPARAALLLGKLTARVDPKNPQQSSYLHLLEGELALSQGDRRRAVELLLLADRENSTPETLGSLAFAYDKSGAAAPAVEYYRRFIATGIAALGFEPQESWTAAHGRLAEIYWERGEKRTTADVLEPLARRWKGADPALPLTRKISGLRRALEIR